MSSRLCHRRISRSRRSIRASFALQINSRARVDLLWSSSWRHRTLSWWIGVLLLFAFSMVQGASGQDQRSDRVHAVGINPLKLLMGLANVEYELRAATHVGVQAFAEYRIGQWIAHPDLVVRGGLRYYVRTSDQDLRGAFSGVSSGVSWSRTRKSADEGVFAASGIGSRIVLADRLYVSPRLVIHYLISQKKWLWGVEAPVGVLF